MKNMVRQYIHSLLVSVFLLLVSLPATAVECFVTVKSYDELKDGMKCLIVRVGNSEFNCVMGKYNSGNNFPSVSINTNKAYSSDIVEYNTNMSMLTLHIINSDNGENCWFFTDQDGKYLSAATSNVDYSYLKSVDTRNLYCDFNISISETHPYNATIIPINKKETCYLQYFDGKFSVYKKIYEPVNLFRKLGDYYLRKLDKDKFGTICLPYAVSAEGVAASGAKYYEILGKTMTSGKVDGIVLAEVGELKACTPYILYTTGDNAIILPEGTAAADVPESPKSNGLVGNLSSKTISAPANSFIIYGDKIRLVPEGVNANVLKNYAYITLDDVPEFKGSLPQNAKRMSVMGGTTGITVSEAAPDRSPAAYNLAGQPADANAHGIVIVNGRKVIY